MTIIEDLQSTIEAGLTAVRTRFDDINSLVGASSNLDSEYIN